VLCSFVHTNLPCIAPTDPSLFTHQIQTLCVTTSSGFSLYKTLSYNAGKLNKWSTYLELFESSKCFREGTQHVFLFTVSKQFQNVTAWLVGSMGSLYLMSTFYVTNRFRDKLMHKICHCAEIPADHCFSEDLGQVRIEYTHGQQYIYVKVSSV
jgi:hypothetical protein